MGTYVYSLRKKHVEARLLGIYPIDVIPLEYAYKESFVREGEYGYGNYQRMAGRVSAYGAKARDHFYDRAVEEFGTTDRDFYIAMGGLEDGVGVNKRHGFLPIALYDTNDMTSFEKVGRLFKVGRGKWLVDITCPKHNWKEYTVADVPPRTIYQCERCDAIKDPQFSTPSTKFC